MEESRAAGLLVRALHGLERIFGLGGDHVNSNFDAGPDAGGATAARVARARADASA
jgi:hypothetical protein